MPFPLAPPVMPIHELLLTAVHAQPSAMVTVTLAGPPVRVKLALVGEIVDVHVAALWLTVNV